MVVGKLHESLSRARVTRNYVRIVPRIERLGLMKSTVTVVTQEHLETREVYFAYIFS